MPKTKEEILKILEKNYQSVQKAELDVYDKSANLSKTFSKDVKELSSTLKTELKGHVEEQKKIETNYKSQLAKAKKEGEAFIKDIELKKEEIKKVFETSMAEALTKSEAELVRLNKELEAVKVENEAQVAETLKDYEDSLVQLEKTIVTINEKDVKDQKTFTTKIEDLRTKHEQNVESLNEKEQTKIEKLTEASNKQVEKLEESLQIEKDKYDKKLATQQPIYEEELEEIDEDLADFKNEYETKHESIRSSADQRIAVREKHLHRAMDENDQRSAKAHKKDIEKFRKEADKDLITLRKNFNSQLNIKTDYRKKFIKENFEKLAELEKEFVKVEKDKQLEIQNVKVTLATDIANTKLEYQKLQAEELNKFNQSFAEVREKQEEVIRDKGIELDKQELEKARIEIEFAKDKAVNVEKASEAVELKEKELRAVNFVKLNDELIAKDVFDNENDKLENEKNVKLIELEKEQKVIEFNQNIENHKNYQKSLSSNKEEFLSYQNKFEPLFTSRAEELLKYEEQEISNRYDLKVAFIEKERVLVNKDYEAMVLKINQVFEIEKAPLEKAIDAIAGEQKEELVKFEEEHQEKVSEYNEKINALDPKADRRERRNLQDQLERLQREFNSTKQVKQDAISNNIKAFEDALISANNRNQGALNEAKALNDAENSRLNRALDLLATNKTNEIEDAKNRCNASTMDIKDYLTKAATRNQSNTMDNQIFLDARVQTEENGIQTSERQFNEAREALNNELNNNLQSNTKAREEGLAALERDNEQEEANFEAFKGKVSSNIKSEEEKAKSLIDEKQNELNKKVSNANDIFKDKVEVIKEELDKQNKDYHNLLGDLNKQVSQEKNHFESELRRISKESDQNLKDRLIDINRKLGDNIASIK